MMAMSKLLLLVFLHVALIQAAGVGTLYGLSWNATLITIDPKNAQVTAVGPPIPNELEAEGLTTMDNKAGIFYMSGANSITGKVELVGLDVQTGGVKVRWGLPFAPGVFVGVGQTIDFDPTTNLMYLSGRFEANGPHVVISLNPLGGNYKKIATYEFIDVLSGASVYDYVNKILWIEVGTNTTIDLIGIDVNTGSIKYQLNSSPFDMETMDFDPVTGLIYGIGLKIISETEYSRTLVTLDSKNGQFNIIGEIPGYFIIDGDIAAIDISSRIIYTILQPNGTNSTPFNLVSIDMDTSNVISSVVMCNDPGLCPWSFEVLNKK